MAPAEQIMVKQRGDAARTAWLAAAIILGVMITYGPALRAGFIWDDDAYVTNNRTLESLDGLRRIWFEIGATDQYYPLVFTSFWVERQLWGLAPMGYHLVNVLLHAASAILLYLLLRRLGVPGAALAAGAFALHPVHVESVAWITERKNTLSGLLYLASMHACVRFSGIIDDTEPRILKSRSTAYVAGLALFILALLSKTVTASLPAAMLLLIWWKRGMAKPRDVLPFVPFFVLGAAGGAVTAYVEKHHVGTQFIDWNLSILDRCLVAGRAICFYFGKLFWPAELVFIYPRWTIDASQAVQYVYPLLVVAIVAAMFLLRRRIGRGPLTAAMFFIGTLTPALGFIDVYPMRFSFVADHFQYLASIGPLALAAAVGYRLVKPAAARMVLALVLCAALGVRARQQTRIYFDVYALWGDTIARNPECWMAHGNLGSQLANDGRLDEAIRHFEESLRIHPAAPHVEKSLADALVSAGRAAESIAHFKAALEMRPEDSRVLTNLGNALLKLGRAEEAAACHRRAVDLAPRDAHLRHNLAVALGKLGRNNEAIVEFETAIRLDETLSASHSQLGALLAAEGRIDEAVERLRTAVALDDGAVVPRVNLASILLSRGDWDEAVALLEAARRVNPDHPAVLRTIEKAKQLRGMSEEPGSAP